MVITAGYDPQDAVSLITRRSRHVAQWFVATQPDIQNLAGPHAFQPQLGPHEGHGTNLARDIQPVVRGQGFVASMRGVGIGHGDNYTPPDGRCRLPLHA